MPKRLRSFLIGFITLSLLTAGLTPASATNLSVSIQVDQGGTLSGSSISTPDPGRNYYLTIFTEGVTLSRNDGGSSGVTVTTLFGNGTYGISAFGTATQLNALLPELSISTEKTCGSNYKIYGQLSSSQITRNPANGHFYLLYQSGPSDYSVALAAAANTSFPLNSLGTKGYLANVTSDAEFQFLQNTYNFNVILGGSDLTQPGTWKWDGGPEKGKTFYKGYYPTGETVGNAVNFWDTALPSSSAPNDHFLLQARNSWHQFPDASDNLLIEFGGFKKDKLSVAGSPDWSENVYTGNAGSHLYSGNGSAEYPYLVKTAADIQNTGQCSAIGVFFKQVKNITLPADFDSDLNYLMGVYDGANHSIQWSRSTKRPTPIVNDDSGVWSIIGYPEVIENPFPFSGLRTSIRNLKLRGNIEAIDAQYVGLLAGDLYWTNVSNVNAAGTIKIGEQSSYVGGLVGYAEASDLDRIKSSVKITGTDPGEAIGGIAGDMQVSGSIHKSSWTGSIKVKGANDINNWIGGIGGYVDGWFMNHNSVNGQITLDGANYVGGLAGELINSGLAYGNKIRVKIVDPGGDRVGGVTGRNYSAVRENLVTSLGISGGLHVGGIVGLSESPVTGNVFVGLKGSVKSDDNAGSIVGYADSTVGQNLAVGKVVAPHTRGALGTFADGFTDVQNLIWSPTNAGVTQPGLLINGEVPVANSLLKKPATYSSHGIGISKKWKDSQLWTQCGSVNSKLPFPTAVFLASPCPGKK